MNKIIKQKNSGYIALLSVIIVGAIATTIAVTFTLLGVGLSATSFAQEQASQARGLANACLEEGLQQIRSSIVYTGSGNLSIGQGTCSYTVTNLGGSNRLVIASSTVGTIIRKVQTNVTAITPTIVTSSWLEVAYF
jgi:hypothetical protein